MGRHEAVWRRLEAILGRLGAILGRLGAILGRLGAILGRLGAILAPSWAVLGAILASQKPPKIIPRSLQEASQNDVNLGRWGTPEILLKPMKNHES